MSVRRRGWSLRGPISEDEEQGRIKGGVLTDAPEAASSRSAGSFWVAVDGIG